MYALRIRAARRDARIRTKKNPYILEITSTSTLSTLYVHNGMRNLPLCRGIFDPLNYRTGRGPTLARVCRV